MRHGSIRKFLFAAATRVAPALLLCALPAWATAQTTTTPSDASEASEWQSCLNGAEPSGENVEPASKAEIARAREANGLPGSGPAILDTNPETDEFVVDFADDVSHERIREFGDEHGLDFELNSRYSDVPNVFVATVDEGDVPYAKTCLTEHAPEGWVQAAEENITYTMLGHVPDDPLYQFQWHFDQIEAEEAWDDGAGDGVVVAVSDTGVAFDEDEDRGIKQPKDLEGTERVDGYDFVDDDDFAWDGHGHGTHVAGTIAQTTDNAYGVAGLAHDASIMPLRVLNSSGFGDISDIADSIRYAADNGADVINLSLGGPLPSLVLKRAVDYAHEQGTLVVAAAGNAGKNAPSYPAAFEHVLAVSATQYDRTTTFYSQWGQFVDIAAPGGNTRVDQNDDGRPDGVLQQTLKDGETDEHDFVLFMGTSMASPHVAAGAALVASQGITNPNRIQDVLQDAASDSERDRFDNRDEYTDRYGAGIMNAAESVEHAVTESGVWRLSGGLALLLFALFGVRRRDMLDIMPDVDVPMVGATIMASSGFFVLSLIPGLGEACGILSALAHPIAEWDMVFFGAGADQSPILASALLPLAAVGLFSHHRVLSSVACGLAIGMAGFCLTEAWLMTSDVHWIPGMAGLLDSAWLTINGVASFTLGYLGLKRY
jgi:serine protease